MASICAARVITPGRVLSPGTVAFDDGVIVDVRAGGGSPEPFTLAPGFIDLQCNGIDGIDVADADGEDWRALDQRLLAHGVVSWCPTLVTAPLDAYAARLTRIASAREAMSATILGAHLEGPFLGGAPGAHPVELLLDFDRDWIDALPDIVRIVTLAPELADASDVIKRLAARGITVSLGHSTATYEQARAATDAGATMVTHVFNGMGALHHRAPGLLGAALTDDRLVCGLIADLVHVHPAAIALVFATKGASRVALVTDSVAGDTRLPDGTLAGSCLAMDEAVANVVRQAGVSVEHAVRAASTTPADLLAEPDRGRIEPGARPDFVALDDDLGCIRTWIGGDVVYARAL